MAATAEAPVNPSAPGEPLPFWKTAWFRRTALVGLGVALPVLCPLLPWPPAQVICGGVNAVVRTINAQPAPAEQTATQQAESAGLAPVSCAALSPCAPESTGGRSVWLGGDRVCNCFAETQHRWVDARDGGECCP